MDSAARTVRSFSAVFDPLRLIGQFPERYPGLLESAGTAGGRYDILPISSGEALTARRGEPGFLSALDDWWSSLRLPTGHGPLPFSGGWLLYLGYEIAGEIEPRVRFPAGTDSVSAFAIRTPAAWVRDRASSRGWLVCEPGCDALLDGFEADVARLHAAAPAGAASFIIEEEDPAQFLRAVRRALDYIAAGDVYQANLSRQWLCHAPGEVDAAAVYRRLRVANPSPFSAFVRCGEFSLLSSSPERLVSIRGGIASTRPIAGTRPRGATPERDAALVEGLLENEKERAEHVMLIDLERNDLGRVCVGGTVRVDEYMTVETYAHVHHIVSNVSGRVRPGVSPVDVIRALYPGGTITGCPKVRCMEIIAELEGTGRGAYTGSIGYLNRDGSCDLNILIRTFSSEGSLLKFRAGAGIVADSEPAQELAETRAKAEGLLRALDAGG